MPYSIWKLSGLQIEPLSYNVGSEALPNIDPDGQGGQKPISEEQLKAQANLKGTVGGVDGILSIQEKVSSGVTQYDAGLKILKEIYGFEDSIAREILGAPIDLKTTSETVTEGE